MKRTLVALVVAALMPALAQSEQAPNAVDVCAVDHARLCPTFSPGSDEATRCLRAQRQEVTPGCRGALAARREWLLSRLRSACAGEIASFCTGARMNARTPMRCLRLHEGQLSSNCRATLPRATS